jgi:hypothetical protein
MRKDSLMRSLPPGPVNGLVELFAIAAAEARTAAGAYDEVLATLSEDHPSSMEPVRCVVETLSQLETERRGGLQRRCLAATNQMLDEMELRWQPIALVPTDELGELANSALSTPYQAWALAVRHRERTFVFWTYIAAHADSPEVEEASEELAREALFDAGLLRRERRLAWRTELGDLKNRFEVSSIGELSSAALMESLLYKAIVRWGSEVSQDERRSLFAAASIDYQVTIAGEASPQSLEPEKFENAKPRALRYAEQLSSIYLAEADKATNQAQLDLAQKLAGSSIARLARLRRIA